MTQQDFTLLDNKSAQPIQQFQAFRGSSAPVRVIVVIDAVNVGYQTLAFERDQLSKLLLANGGRLAHPTTLAVLMDNGMQLQDRYSQDGAALDADLKGLDIGLREIRRSALDGGAERLQISVNALQELSAHEDKVPGRKLVIWISPGWPLLSGPAVQLSTRQQDAIFRSVMSLSSELRQSKITLYSVDPLGASESVARASYYETYLDPLRKAGQADFADLGLQVLAVQSGGLALTSSNDIAGLIEKCIADADAYYEISFAPAPPERSGDFHRIELKVRQPDLTARTRQGYYAQPEAPDASAPAR